MLKCVNFDFNVMETFLCTGFTIEFFTPHMMESEQPVSNLYFRLKKPLLFSCVVAKFNKSLVYHLKIAFAVLPEFSETSKQDFSSLKVLILYQKTEKSITRH